MVFVRRIVDPALKQAKVNVSLSVSPTLSLSDPDARLEVKLSLSMAWAQPGKEGQSLTFCAQDSVFEVTDPEEGSIDVFGRGGFGRLRNIDDRTRSISLGLFRMHRFPKITSPDLRERGYPFVSVPGATNSDAPVANVIHELTWERIFRYEGKLTKEKLIPGEKFSVILGKGLLGALWWCWGDLETDLKDKRLHIWHENTSKYGPEKPDDEFVQEGNWVLGEDPNVLDWEVVTPGREAVFKIIE